MQTSKKYFFGPLILFIFLGSCSSLERSRLELTQDVLVSFGDAEPTFHKKGEVLVLPENKSVLIEAPGKVGVLVIPQSATPNTTKISLKAADQWATQFVQTRIDKSLNEVTGAINEIQMLLSTRKFTEAKWAVGILRQRYPNVPHLKFLEATCHAALGETTKAAILLQDLSQEFPQNQASKKLYITLTQPPKSVSRLPAEIEHKSDLEQEHKE